MEHDHHNQPEQAPDTQPRIWVGSLSDYNAGILHGTWINADQPPEDIHDDITKMLKQSHEPPAEEFAIFDFENFGPWQPGEYDPIDLVAQIARGITEHGVAYAHWATLVGTSNDDLDAFDDHYLGHWPSVTAYAEELIDDFGVHVELDQLKVPLKDYIRIDTDALVADLTIEHLTSADDTGVHIWSQP